MRTSSGEHRSALAGVAVVLSCCALPAAARAEDEWFAPDKGLHFGVSAGLAAAGYGVSAIWLEPRWARASVGFAAAFSLGLAKEAWDATGRGDPSGRDVAWDVLGALTGSAIAWGIDLAWQRGKQGARARTRPALVSF